ncbi:hypothetical protein CFBP6600_44900 (plasmid) [Xanthomonas arboricola pv. corylina]|nr:hypothetical protein CFBP6600_44900 [Xanthomonas arboricola pv. corylina]CAE6868825.1 hypothetical protein CFBP6600_44900 [Xanthomonas arboricola pv. corylina]
MGAQVIEAFAKGWTNRRILAGKPRQVGRWVIGEDGTRRRLLSFAPGDRFALDVWEQNDYGTTRWRVVLCEALPAGQAGESVPAVRPDVAILAGQNRVLLVWQRLRFRTGPVSTWKACPALTYPATLA